MSNIETTRVCVALCEKDFSALRNSAARAVAYADVIELRLDCLETKISAESLAPLLKNPGRPLILTFRPAEQGGLRNLTLKERVKFWKTVAPRGENLSWDIEGDLVHEVAPDWPRTIVSHHDFAGVPADLDQIYEYLAQTPARVIKIAVQANEIADCLPVFQLLERARRDGRQVIAIAMGNAGLATRILGPARGSSLTYGSLGDESTAPGQVDARKLRSLYRIDYINEETMVCGLVGLPVMHSVSPHLHNAAFAAAGINGVYLPFEVSDVKAFCKRMVHPLTRELDWNLRGLSVTAPHKQDVIECLDWIDPVAGEIGAVNTVVVEKDRLLGYNTDAAGLVDPLTKRFQSLAQMRVAVIGAGGAARAAVWALQHEKAHVTLFARDCRSAEPLVERFGASCQALSAATFGEFDLVINATPLGSGKLVDHSPATAEQLTGARCVYDLVYNPIETKLLRAAREAGCQTLGGLEMLVAQAKAQFQLWTDRQPSSAVMFESGAAALIA